MFIAKMCDSYGPVVGRVLMGGVFLSAGVMKLMGGVAMLSGYIGSVGLPLPTLLAVLTIALEIGAGLALIVGWQTKHSALVLAGFTILATYFFHFDFADQTQMVMFTKNVAMLGGLLYIATFGAGKYSVDSN